jgi:acetyl-CoA carboxylase biotin carboxyl carrier protein
VRGRQTAHFLAPAESGTERPGVERHKQMNLKEIKELILFLKEEEITEFELERGDVKLRIKRGTAEVGQGATDRIIAVHSAALPVAQASLAAVPDASAHGPGAVPPLATPTVPAPEEEFHIVRSPIVGTYYESPSPGSPPFVKPGDAVEAGQVLCIVEAMKLMNEIEADVAGEIVKGLVKNGQPIEYGQELFAIRPKK